MADRFLHFVDKNTRLINSALDDRMPAEDTRPSTLHKAMRYSVFAGGKRLRPLLCLAACEALGGRIENAIVPAIAIEVLHTYTLIHDDLPCMDDDDMRRGAPTCHVVFGEAEAVLAGDALLTLAFEWLACSESLQADISSRLSLELASAAGSRGVIGGQFEDMDAEGKQPDQELVEYIHAHKTARLIQASVRMGGIAASATKPQLSALTSYGGKLGLAFQITDDILNETSTLEELGKKPGTDRQRGKLTYVAAYGMNAARKAAERLTHEAIEEIMKLAGGTEVLVSFAERMMERRQ